MIERRFEIPFNVPRVTGKEAHYITDVLARAKFSGGGHYTQRCRDELRRLYPGSDCFLTTSGTHALEMAALLCDLQPGDEVIVPSFAFPTTASAFVRCGAKIVFVDIDADTLNISVSGIRAALTDRTRVIVALHYGGVSCDMDAICKIAQEQNLLIVEDAAHAIDAYANSEPVGLRGDLSCLSFHESKNIHCGEGGALICNNPELISRCEIILEKGTDRTKFFRGEVNKYEWCELGSSFVLSDLNAAYLYAQLIELRETTECRRLIWKQYQKNLKGTKYVSLAMTPQDCVHNGHVFRIMLESIATRNDLLQYLNEQGINATFHYQPLHLSPAGIRYGHFNGDDQNTSHAAETILRLPMYYGFDKADYVCEKILNFFQDRAL